MGQPLASQAMPPTVHPQPGETQRLSAAFGGEGGRQRASLSPEQGLSRTHAPAMALPRAQGRPLWWACRVGVRALCPHRSALPAPSPGPLPRAPPLLCGPSPVSMGPGREGCWLARPHFLLARRLRAASGTKGGLCLVLGLLPARPLPPRGPGVMFVFVAKRESSGQAARAQCTDSLGYQPQAQEPGSRQPVPDPAGLPPSPPWPPEAPRQQPGSSVPALRLLLCRLLPSPAHGMRLSSPRPARHPLAL